MSTPPIDYHALASKHGALYSRAPDANTLPPEVARIKSAVGAELVQGNPLPDGGIASVGQNEPHKIEVNDPAKFKQGPQTLAHEVVHLALNQMAGPVRAAIPKDNPKAPYDISGVDALRAKGLKIWQLPQEQAATIVQTYTADPSQRARLQPWISDLNNAPLSLVQPTSPQDKTINIKPRMPVPPVEAWQSLTNIKAQAAALQAKLRGQR